MGKASISPGVSPGGALSAPRTLGSHGQLGGAERCALCPQLIKEEAASGTDMRELLDTLNLDLKQPVEQVSAWGSLGKPGEAATSCPSPASPRD